MNEGVNVAKRALVASESAHVDCHIDGDEWTVEIKGIRETVIKFRLGQEIQRVTPDGRHLTVSRLFCP